VSSNALLPFEPRDVGQLIETIWTVVLGRDVQPVSLPASLQVAAGILTGMVEITGAWEGVVVLECPLGLVRQAAGTMFEIEPELVTSDQLEDALGELTNIVGGNFKALLPASAHLGLPAVAKDTCCARALPGAAVLAKLAFETTEFVFLLTILSANTISDDSPQSLEIVGNH